MRAVPAASAARRGPPLGEFLFGAYRQRVLDLLFSRINESFHVREIARLTEVPAGSLHRELRQLETVGLLRSARQGNQVLYRANAQSQVYDELAGLLRKAAAQAGAQAAATVLHSPQAAYVVPAAGSLPMLPKRALAAICRRYGVKKLSLFGSAARGELRPDSDVDLLVEFKPGEGPSLWGLADMREDLSVLFGGRRIDIATPEYLKNRFRRAAIERDLTLLHAA